MAMERSSHRGAGPATDALLDARPRLLGELRTRMRRLGLPIRTEEAYVGWLRKAGVRLTWFRK